MAKVRSGEVGTDGSRGIAKRVYYLKAYSPDILISGSPDLPLLVKESIICDHIILLRMI